MTARARHRLAVAALAVPIALGPIGLPAIGVIRDQQVQRRLETAAAGGGPVAAPGFAVAFGTMVLVAALHFALLIGFLTLAALGTDAPRQCFS